MSSDAAIACLDLLWNIPNWKPYRLLERQGESEIWRRQRTAFVLPCHLVVAL